jgi:uracil phosphoribosyltransferase
MYAPASLAAGTNRYGLLGLRDDAELIAHRAQEHVTGRTLVLGWEEDMYLPLQVAANLDGDISFGSTTRSPAIPLDIDGYGIRHALAFAVNDETRYAYNVNGYDTVIAVVDRHADTRGLTDALRTVTGRVLVVLTGELPTPLRGPYFGSYDTNEVAWLLTDVSDDAVEMDLNARETLVQNGGHYADSLPVEYEPTEDYLALYEQALTRNASRVALDVARACERLLAARRWPRHIILVSLARAGVPAGILMKRYLQSRVPHVEHYAVSIIRGRGIDENALDFIAAHHNVADVVFVDGWTGKGAIASELSAALMTYAQKTGVSFPTEVAVIADPAGVATYAGSPDDYLIPSAALNSTVSGLVSRTVLAPSLRAGDYHGAKFYVDLMGVDRSREFIEAVSAVLPSNPVFRPARTFMGTTSVVAGLCAEYGIESANRVKPGVAETTRALLRRVPWKVLIDPAAHAAEVAHIRQLAAERGVPVEECPVSPYAAVALIRDARTVS